MKRDYGIHIYRCHLDRLADESTLEFLEEVSKRIWDLATGHGLQVGEISVRQDRVDRFDELAAKSTNHCDRASIRSLTHK